MDDRSRPRLLLTNDDGIDAPGLQVVADALAGRYDVTVVAPDRDLSGVGTSLRGLGDPGRPSVHRRDLGEVEAFAIDGPPGLAVMAAALGAFGAPPDLVVSGPNAGRNTGAAVLHSGTVGAVLAARTFGIGGVALSVAAGPRWHWGTAAAVAGPLVEWALDRDDVVTLNVNVPALPIEAIRGSRWAPIDAFGHFTVATRTADGTAVDFAVHDPAPPSPSSDTAITDAGYIAVTLLETVVPAPAPPVDAAELTRPRAEVARAG